MLRRIVLLAIALLALPALLTAATLEIRGRLLSESDRVPVTGARVALGELESGLDEARRLLAGRYERDTLAEAKSGADGRFSVTVPRTGFWSLRVEAEGFLPQEVPVFALLESRDLDPITLAPGVEVEVSLLGEKGVPIVGAPVFADATGSLYAGGRSRNARQHAVTDGKGRVRFVAAKEGPLEVAAWSSEYGLVVGKAQGGSTTIAARSAPSRRLRILDSDGRALGRAVVLLSEGHWPLAASNERGEALVRIASPAAAEVVVATGNAPDPGHATALLSARTAEGVEEPFTITLTRSRSIAGRVVDLATGAPLSGAAVWTVDAARGVVHELSDADGRFALPESRDPNGAYIVASAPGYALSMSHQANPSGDAIVTLGLSRGVSLSGRVVRPDGSPAPEVEIEAEIQDSHQGYSPRRLAAYVAPSLGLAPNRTWTDREGRFEFRSLFPELGYELSFRADGFADATHKEAALEPGERREGLEFTLDRGAQVTGTVVASDGSLLAGAEVFAFRSTGQRGSFSMFDRRRGELALSVAATDEEGRFALESVAAGSLDLEVRALEHAPFQRVAVELPAGRDALDVGLLELMAAAPVRGVVVDSVGSAIEGARVIALPAHYPEGMVSRFCAASRFSFGVLSGSDGRFELLDLLPGAPTTLLACSEGLAAGTRVGVRPPTTSPVTITLSRPSALEGRVVDGEGNGVADATVSFELTSRRRSGSYGSSGESTDSDGRFRLEDVPTGAGMVVAVAPGLLETRLSVETEAGLETTDLVLELKPGAVVRGRVRDAQGRGVPDALVGAETTSDHSYSRGMGQSDADGRYELPSVALGRQMMRVQHESYASVTREVEVTEGENEVDFQFEPGARIAGRVVNAKDEPVADAHVTFSGTSDDHRNVATGADGRFEILNVRAGEGRVNASHENSGSNWIEIVVGDPSAEDLLLRVGGDGVIVGQLVGLEPTEWNRARVWASSENGSGHGFGRGDGSYRIEGLAAGEYRVRASIDRNAKLATGTIDVAPGGVENLLDLDFSEGVRLSGVVLDEEGAVAGADISVRGLTAIGSYRANTDANGRFELGNVTPGRYEVYAESERGEAFEEIDVETDADVTLEISGGTLVGQVLAADSGAPLADASILIEPVEGRSSRRRTVSARVDSAGSFRAAGVSGELRVRAIANGYAQSTEIVDVGAGGTEQVDFELTPSDGVEFRIRAGAVQANSLTAAVFDTANRLIVESSVQITTDGTARLDHVPDGSWRLVVSASGAARITRNVTLPASGPVVLDLMPEARLEVHVPELVGSSSIATLELIGADGLPFEPASFRTKEWSLYRGSRTIGHLPAGGWAIRVATSDGRSWTGRATTVSGRTVEIELGGP